MTVCLSTHTYTLAHTNCVAQTHTYSCANTPRWAAASGARPARSVLHFHQGCSRSRRTQCNKGGRSDLFCLCMVRALSHAWHTFKLGGTLSESVKTLSPWGFRTGLCVYTYKGSFNYVTQMTEHQIQPPRIYTHSYATHRAVPSQTYTTGCCRCCKEVG